MQFETIAIVVFALAALIFVIARRHVIRDLKREIDMLRNQEERLRGVAVRQRDEIDRLIHMAEQERRARQMATLTSQKPAPRPPATPPKGWKDPAPDNGCSANFND